MARSRRRLDYRKLKPGEWYHLMGGTNPAGKRTKNSRYTEKGEAIGIEFYGAYRFLGIDAEDAEDDFYLFSEEWKENGQRIARINRFNVATMKATTITYLL
jgi:hypothetical protein